MLPKTLRCVSRAAASARSFSTSGHRRSTLILLEPTASSTAAGDPSPASLAAITAAVSSGLPGPIHALAISSSLPKLPSSVAEVLDAGSVDGLDHGLPERLAPILADLVKSRGVTHLVAPHTAFARNVLPRTAALLDVAPLMDVVAVEGDVFTRMVYAGNAVTRVRSTDAVKVITVRPTAFAPTQSSHDLLQAENVTKVQPSDGVPLPGDEVSKWVSEEIATSAGRPDLASAKRVVAGGRALGSADNFSHIYALADKLNAAVGASRAAVDAGYVDNALQIGQTGKNVAPELYIAVGISGAIQHLAGMKDSRVIVAVNKDADAPIFQIADYGLVGDLFKIVPEMTEKL